MAPKRKRLGKKASKEELTIDATQKRGPEKDKKEDATQRRKKKSKNKDGATKEDSPAPEVDPKTHGGKKKKKGGDKTLETTDGDNKTDQKTEAQALETTRPGSDQTTTPTTSTPHSKAQSINNSHNEDKCLGTMGGKLLSADDEKELQRQLTNNPWYHGLMPRDEIEDLLKVDGQFLVRKTDVAGKPRYAVSVMNGGRIRHILLNFHSGLWWLKELKKNNLISLIREHVDTKTPVQTDGTLLIKPVPRPDYCILHDHVEIGRKLGGGAFGDVHIGKWKKNDKESIDVAVKKMKSAVKKKQRSEFVKEAKLMRRFSHKNIVQVVGVAAQEEPILILLELASGGALKSKLHDHPDTPKEKLACTGSSS
ncbi:Tyrosine-protein kinase [Aphelenchoides besseyi]|nr:Tyrosine-protein kinase [Aphelenchoides besseyi]